MTKVTFLHRVSNTGGQAITLNELIALIRDDARTKQATQAIQREYGPAIEAGHPEGKKSYQKQKSETLSVVQLSGFNPDRSSGADLSNFRHSGLIVLDIDDQGAELQAVLSAEARKHQSLTLCAHSVSGIFNGNFWAAFKVEVPQGEDVKQVHKDWHSLLTEQLNKAVGVKLKGNDSLKRLRYITHDPDLFFNPDAEALPFELLKQWRAKKAAEVPQVKRKAAQSGRTELKSANAFDDAVTWAKAKGYDYVNGQKHDFRTHIAIRLNWYGVPQVDAEIWVETNYPGKSGIGNSVSGPYKSYASDFGKGKHVLQQRAAYKEAQKQLTPQGAKIILDKGQYLSDKAQYIFSLLNEHKKIHLQAGTGSGKSYMAAVELGKHTDRKIIIACSLNAKVMKDAEEHGIAAVTGALMRDFGKRTLLDTADAAQVVLCSYEQVPRLAARYGDEDPVFVLDESHSLSYGYRQKSLSNMWSAMHEFDCIAMTGTPLPYLAVSGFFKVEVRTQRAQIDWHLRNRMRGPLAGTIVQHIAQTDFSTRRVVCLINSKAELHAAKKALLKKGLKSSEVVTLYSSDEVKARNAFKQLIEARGGGESFADAVKVVLTTSVIGEGVDVYSSKEVDFISVHREQKFNPVQLVQFADRWRTAGAKKYFTYLLEADQPEDWQRGDKYRSEAFYKLQLDYFSERAALYNDRIKDVEKRCLDQRLVSTTTQFSDEEQNIVRCSKTGKYSVCVPSLIIKSEAQRHKHRTQDSAVQEVLKAYPYFNLIDERAAVDDVTDADVYTAANEEADAKEQAKAMLAQLVANDFDTLVQAVALKSQDRKITQLATKQKDLTEKANQLHTAHPALFDRFLGTSEGIVKRYAQATELGIQKGDYIQISVAGGFLVYAEVVKRFIEGLKLQLLLLLFLNRIKDQVSLTVQQARDGQRLERFILAVSAHEGQELTGAKLKQITDQTLGHRAKKFTIQQAVTLASYFFEMQGTKSRHGRGYVIGSQVNIKAYLQRAKVGDCEAVLRWAKILQKQGLSNVYEKNITHSLSTSPVWHPQTEKV